MVEIPVCKWKELALKFSVKSFICMVDTEISNWPLWSKNIFGSQKTILAWNTQRKAREIAKER